MRENNFEPKYCGEISISANVVGLKIVYKHTISNSKVGVVEIPPKMGLPFVKNAMQADVF